LLEQLPASATFEDLMHELYELRSIERGLADAEAGRLTSHDEARRIVLQGIKK
jgi:predicted transcriptional regulator